MAGGESFYGGDHIGAGGTTSFSELLFSNDDDDIVGLDMDHTFNHFSSSVGKPPKMLCFGGYDQNVDEIVMLSHEVTKTIPQNPGVTCSDSSSASSGNNNNNNSVNVNSISKCNRTGDGSNQEQVQCAKAIERPPLTSQRTAKKTKTENPKSTGHAKVKKEKLGERITALQQLVAPYGKTDTASVLHEAMGYIRFLHDQVQVLCAPYLQHRPEGGEGSVNLRSRGLCVVPVECTAHVASSNGADYWSPAMGSNFSLPSSTNQ